MVYCILDTVKASTYDFKGNQRIASDTTGTSCVVAWPPVVKPSAKGKRKIQGAVRGRTPLGKGMAELQPCISEELSSDPPVPCLAVLVGIAPATVVRLALLLSAGYFIQQQFFTANTTSVLPKSPAQKVPFTDEEVQLSSYSVGSLCLWHLL